MRLPAIVVSAALFLPVIFVPAVGCHSAYVDAVVRNRTDRPISLVEIDYPSASFGTQTLMPQADFHYRFKVQGAGDLKLLYTDSSHTERQSQGPHVDENAEGSLAVTVTHAGVQWDAKLSRRSGRP